MTSPSKIALEFERLNDDFEKDERRTPIIEEDGFDESFLDNLESEFIEESEITIADFISPKKDFGHSFSREVGPKEEVFDLMRDISKNLGDLKVLIRS